MSQSWPEVINEIDALDSVQLDEALLGELQTAAGGAGRINFYVPSFKYFETDEIASCGKNSFPAVSVTGNKCKLQCDHCKARVLEGMVPAETPEELERLAGQFLADGAKGMLISGGSNHQNVIDYPRFFPAIRRIKDAHPDFQIAMHTGLVDEEYAKGMEEAGVDVAMLDVIGHQDTVTQVYHLKRPVEDFEKSLEALSKTSMKLVPHIVLGLHYGQFLGEDNALEMIARHSPDALILVIVEPYYAPSSRPFETPSTEEIGRFFLRAKQRMDEVDAPTLLGCARPPGEHRVTTDTYAVLAGLDGIAFPSDGMLELADKLDLSYKVTPSCCSVVVGEEIIAPEEPAAATA
jgi:hypothetical protein